MDLPHGSDGEEPTCNIGDLGLIPGLRGSPAEGKGYPLCPWRIPWTEEPGRLQAVGSQSAGHD